ncbi:MAG: hypothetical protein KGJ58_02545 [Patescibacteria group bacterium]|nr:hypothetical protein [Patescibacteria group bacterium]MDE1988279.1 hypothetical protein [Patescibacteria group bacterium]MDE2218306.1 hypothetical protein [Patescibacteria group bacterium]
MNAKIFFQSKNFKRIICGIAIAIAILAVFQAGMFVGYRKASFSYRWGDNYHRAFGERGEHMTSFFRDGDFTNSSGAIGKIVKIDLPTLMIESKDGIEKAVSITDDTIIKKFRETVKPEDLKAGDFVIAIGSPNDKAGIEAKIVRIIPNSENFIGTGTRNK